MTAAVVIFGAGQASAQTYEQGGARITFQVFNSNSSSWGSNIDCAPGQRIEWRAVLSYTGTRTDLFALGEALYQPVFSNADTEGVGAMADQVGAWRNGGVSGNAIAGSMLTEAEGQNGSELGSYGRVRFGATASGTGASNTITTFRHTNGADGGPAGNWIRIAGSSVSQWPRSLAGPVPPLDVTQGDINNITRGISARQVSQALSPTFHVGGTSGLVVFRGSYTLSTDWSSYPRTLQITTFRESMLRVGGATDAGEGDDRRYISWQTGPGDSGSHHTLDPVFVPATFGVLAPAPGSVALLAVGGVWCARRRRV